MGIKIPLIDPATGMLRRDVVPAGTGDYSFEYFADEGDFPPVGYERTLYVVTAAGREAAYFWDVAGSRYFMAAGASDNIVDF